MIDSLATVPTNVLFIEFPEGHTCRNGCAYRTNPYSLVGLAVGDMVRVTDQFGIYESVVAEVRTDEFGVYLVTDGGKVERKCLDGSTVVYWIESGLANTIIDLIERL